MVVRLKKFPYGTKRSSFFTWCSKIYISNSKRSLVTSGCYSFEQNIISELENVAVSGVFQQRAFVIFFFC